jgi:hypothetical protein
MEADMSFTFFRIDFSILPNFSSILPDFGREPAFATRLVCSFGSLPAFKPVGGFEPVRAFALLPPFELRPGFTLLPGFAVARSVPSFVLMRSSPISTAQPRKL